MRYPTLRRDTLVDFELRTLFRSDDKQDDSPHQREPAEYRWNRYSVVFFRGGMDRADIKYFFLMSVIEALVGEAERAQNYQENSNPHDRFHIVLSISEMTHASRAGRCRSVHLRTLWRFISLAPAPNPHSFATCSRNTASTSRARTMKRLGAGPTK